MTQAVAARVRALRQAIADADGLGPIDDPENPVLILIEPSAGSKGKVTGLRLADFTRLFADRIAEASV